MPVLNVGRSSPPIGVLKALLNFTRLAPESFVHCVKRSLGLELTTLALIESLYAT